MINQIGIDIQGRCLRCGLYTQSTSGCSACSNITFTPSQPMRTPHKCPVCDGSGKVSRPPWVAGDQLTWDASTAEPYECQACNATGVVWG